jgi:hypothetical protein
MKKNMSNAGGKSGSVLHQTRRPDKLKENLLGQYIIIKFMPKPYRNQHLPVTPDLRYLKFDIRNLKI